MYFTVQKRSGRVELTAGRDHERNHAALGSPQALLNVPTMTLNRRRKTLGTKAVRHRVFLRAAASARLRVYWFGQPAEPRDNRSLPFGRDTFPENTVAIHAGQRVIGSDHFGAAANESTRPAG